MKPASAAGCTSRDHASGDKPAAPSEAAQSAAPRAAAPRRVMEPQVTVVSRAQWRAAAPKQQERLRSAAAKVVVHHTALPRCHGLQEHKDRILSIQRNHMAERGFSDVGYNFLVGADGSVFEGRGWGVVGAHTKGNNYDSLGIAFMGDFNNDAPSKEAISSVRELLRSGVSQGFLCKKFTVFGHRDLGDTQCPGDHLYAALPQLGGGAGRVATEDSHTD